MALHVDAGGEVTVVPWDKARWATDPLGMAPRAIALWATVREPEAWSCASKFTCPLVGTAGVIGEEEATVVVVPVAPAATTVDAARGVAAIQGTTRDPPGPQEARLKTGTVSLMGTGPGSPMWTAVGTPSLLTDDEPSPAQSRGELEVRPGNKDPKSSEAPRERQARAGGEAQPWTVSAVATRGSLLDVLMRGCCGCVDNRRGGESDGDVAVVSNGDTAGAGETLTWAIGRAASPLMLPALPLGRASPPVAVTRDTAGCAGVPGDTATKSGGQVPLTSRESDGNAAGDRRDN